VSLRCLFSTKIYFLAPVMKKVAGCSFGTAALRLLTERSNQSWCMNSVMQSIDRVCAMIGRCMGISRSFHLCPVRGGLCNPSQLPADHGLITACCCCCSMGRSFDVLSWFV